MPPRPASDASYGAHVAVTITINRYHLRHMLRVYQAFDGDLLEAIVLGEVAHHNVSGVQGLVGSNLDFARRLATSGRPAPHELLPTNAHSIALSTGIPRETVRRKVASLIKRGWLTRDARGNLTVTAAPGTHFRTFTDESERELFDVANAVAVLRGQLPFPSEPTPPPPRPRAGSRRR